MKEAIIQAASERFMRYGVRNVTMDDIAANLGISKKTLYQVFKDKKELVFETARAYLEEERRLYEGIHQQSKDVIHEMIMANRLMQEMLGTIHPGMLRELRRFYQESWNLYLDYKEKVFVLDVIDNLDRGKEEGYYRKEINSEIMARLHIENVQWILEELDAKSGHESDRYQQQYFDHFMHGLCTKKGIEKYEKYLSETI